MNESLKNNVLKILEKEQTQLDDAFKAQSPGVEAPKKVEKVTVTQNDDGTWSKNVEEVDSNVYDDTVVGTVEAEIKRDASTLQEFCKEFDDIIISYNVQINQKKQELVDLCLLKQLPATVGQVLHIRHYFLEELPDKLDQQLKILVILMS